MQFSADVSAVDRAVSRCRVRGSEMHLEGWRVAGSLAAAVMGEHRSTGEQHPFGCACCPDVTESGFVGAIQGGCSAAELTRGCFSLTDPSLLGGQDVN